MPFQFVQQDFGQGREEGTGIPEVATDLIAGVVTGRKISLRPST